MGRSNKPQGSRSRPVMTTGGEVRAVGARPISTATIVRLVVLALSLTGIFAMHGLSATDVAGHQLPLSPNLTAPAHDRVSAASAGMSSLRDGPTPADAHGAPASGMSDARVDPAAGTVGHTAMAGCVAILLGLIGYAAMRPRLISQVAGVASLLVSRRVAVLSARAPPQPIFLSLCVFRT